MNDAELRDTVRRIQAIVGAETGGRLGAQAEVALGKILRDVASHNLSGAEGFAPQELTILFADLRGFTSMSARNPAATVLNVVNRCLIMMSEVVVRHRGNIDKFMGDSIMVLFGPQPGADAPARRALECAVDLQLAMDELNRHYRELGLPELFLGIGVNTGLVMAGTLGSESYAAYTVIGDEVNLASRIEAFSLRGQILISQSTYERCSDFVSTAAPMTVHIKGKAEPVVVREVLEIPSSGKSVPRREIRKSPRVKVTMPFTWHRVEADATLPQAHRGVIRDIGYHGVLAEVREPLEPLAEVHLHLELALVNHRASDIYGRVIKVQKGGDGWLCGIEFTSLGGDTARHIELLVQLLIQGSEPS